MPTGATVAALTTSLRRRRAVSALGLPVHLDARLTFTPRPSALPHLDWEADEFMQFVADLEPNKDGGLQIMYGSTAGGPHRVDRDELSGTMRPPGPDRERRVQPRQNDVYGAVLDSYASYVGAGTCLGGVAPSAVAGGRRHLGMARADQGICEARAAPQHYGRRS